MIDILGDPVKLLASLFLFILLIGSTFVAVWNTIHAIPIPIEVTSILSAGIGYCLTALGFAHGSNTTQSAVNNLVKAQNERTDTTSGS